MVSVPYINEHYNFSLHQILQEVGSSSSFFCHLFPEFNSSSVCMHIYRRIFYLSLLMIKIVNSNSALVEEYTINTLNPQIPMIIRIVVQTKDGLLAFDLCSHDILIYLIGH